MKCSLLCLLLLFGCAKRVSIDAPTIQISDSELIDAIHEVQQIRAALPGYANNDLAPLEWREILIVQDGLESIDSFKGEAYIEAVRELEIDWQSLVHLDRSLQEVYVN